MVTTQETNDILQKVGEVKDFVQGRWDELDGKLDLEAEERSKLHKEILAVSEELQAQRRQKVLAEYEAKAPKLVYQTVRHNDRREASPLQLNILRSFAKQMIEEPGIEQVQQRYWNDVIKRVDEVQQAAFDPTQAGLGAEWVTTGMAGQLWEDVHLATLVSANVPRIMMPTPSFDLPYTPGRIYFFRGVPNLAATSSTLDTAQRTLVAAKLIAAVPWAYEFDEDSVLAAMPLLTSEIIRYAAESIDDILLNGDTTNTSANINDLNGTGLASVAGLDHFLAFDGLIKRPVISNTGQLVNVAAAPSTAAYNNVMKKMGKYAANPTGMVFVVDVSTYLASLAIAELVTIDKFGPQATIVTGSFSSILGVPTLVSGQMLLADSNGKVDTNTANRTLGRILAFNRSQYIQGFVREVTMEADRDIQKQQVILVCSYRMAFHGREAAASDTAVALGRNVTV